MLLVLCLVLSLGVLSTSGLPVKEGNRTLVSELGPTRQENGGNGNGGSGPLEALAAGVTDVRLRLMQNQMDLIQARLLKQESSTDKDGVMDELRKLELNITKLVKQSLRHQRYFSPQQIIVGNVTMDLPVDAESESVDSDRDDDVILMQQHFGGTSFFDKPWVEYRDGFGHVTGNYWLGNDRINELTKNGLFKLRVDLLSRFNNRWYWAEYSEFRVYDASMKYVLNVDGYRGTAGDAMRNANGALFSTKDSDNDLWANNCAAEGNHGCGSGFWYKVCGEVFINAPLSGSNGFKWHQLPTGSDKTLVYTRMTLIRK